MKLVQASNTALMPEEEGVSELEQYLWGAQPADEPGEE